MLEYIMGFLTTTYKCIIRYPLSHVLGLSIALANAKFKLRTENSIIGVGWYLLEPLAVFGILLLIQSVVHIEHAAYPLYLFVGLIMFNFFANATNHAAQALTGNREYITWLKLRFESFILAHVIQFAYAHVFEFVILIALIAYLGTPLLGPLLYLLVFVPFFFFTLGASFILATITVYSNDLAQVWRVALSRLLWLGTPIFYILEPGSVLYTLNQWNPLYYFIEMGRSVLVYQRAPDMHIVLPALCVATLTLLAGILFFHYTYRSLPEKL